MAKKRAKKTKKQVQAYQFVDNLVELHKLQGILLRHLKKSLPKQMHQE